MDDLSKRSLCWDGELLIMAQEIGHFPGQKVRPVQG